MNPIILCDNASPEKVIALCEKYRCGIEIQGFCHPNETDKKDELLSLYNRLLPAGIKKYLHAPFWDLCLGSANNKIRVVTEFYFDYAYGVANALSCLGITVHHGFVPHTSFPANWVKRSVQFWQAFFNTHPGGIKMFMENQCEENPEPLIGIIDACQNSRLAVNLDIGHAHCNNPLPVLDWVKRLGGRIAYVHIHQNNGENDDHFGLNQGNIPMDAVLKALKEHAPHAIWALECHPDSMEESLIFLRERGYA